jgi:hypothetical protein
VSIVYTRRHRIESRWTLVLKVYTISYLYITTIQIRDSIHWSLQTIFAHHFNFLFFFILFCFVFCFCCCCFACGINTQKLTSGNKLHCTIKYFYACFIYPMKEHRRRTKSEDGMHSRSDNRQLIARCEVNSRKCGTETCDSRWPDLTEANDGC